MRQLNAQFMYDLLTGKLKDVLTMVKSDDTLCLEIRDNYVNIYYRGGNLLRIEQTGVGYKGFFDKNYCRKHLNRISLIPPDDFTQWIENIPFIKADMDTYFCKKSSLEKEYQQLVLRENNLSKIANETDYFIIDLEYSDSKNKSRFDMLAMKWLSNASSHKKADDVHLVLIEKKYGDGALSGSAGIQKHFDDWYNFLKDRNKVDELYKEAESLIKQKVELGLLFTHGKEIELVRDKPELLLLIANHKPDKTVLRRELNIVIQSANYKTLKQTVDMRIATASNMGYGLYSDFMIDIEDFLRDLPNEDQYN